MHICATEYFEWKVSWGFVTDKEHQIKSGDLLQTDHNILENLFFSYTT
jgi:hypothetical protein